MKKLLGRALLCCLALFLLAGCVDQSAKAEKSGVVATSIATMQIMEKLDVDLVGVPKSSLSEIPKRYSSAKTVGAPMAPDIEVLKSMNPKLVLSPISLSADLKPKYEAANLNHYFLNLNSVENMYASIAYLGKELGREEQASALIQEFEDYYAQYRQQNEGKQAPTVLILMGLPGSYVVATEESYVGSLVKMAGGKNVYQGATQDFLSINTEDMLEKNPDIILRTSHALPEQVQEMFAEEFASNDIWKHFRAVQGERVYDLPYNSFGMSANFQYQDALAILQTLFYGEE